MWGGCIASTCRWRPFRLDVVEVVESDGTAERLIPKVTVRGDVDLNNKGWEEDMHAEAVHPDMAASALTLMCPQAVEGVAKIRHVETIRNKDFLVVERDDGRSLSRDQCK